MDKGRKYSQCISQRANIHEEFLKMDKEPKLQQKNEKNIQTENLQKRL